MRELTKVEIREVGGGDVDITDWLTSCGNVAVGTWSGVEAAASGSPGAAWAGALQAGGSLWSCVKDTGGVITALADAWTAAVCTDQGNGYSECTFEASGNVPIYISIPNATPVVGQVDTTPTAFETTNMMGDISNGVINQSEWDNDFLGMEDNSYYYDDYSYYNGGGYGS